MAPDFENTNGIINTLKKSLAVPLVADGNCIGTISLYAEDDISYSSEHVQIMENVAAYVASVLDEARHRISANQSNTSFDALSGTYTLSYLSAEGPRLLAQAAETNAPLSLLYVGIRNFPQLVNIFGIHNGDSLMRRIVETLRSELRESDVVVRYGLHGFVALLPGVRTDQASRCAQRLQHHIRNLGTGGVPGHSILISCQTATASFPRDGTSLLELLQSIQQVLTQNSRLSLPSDDTDRNVVDFPFRP